MCSSNDAYACTGEFGANLIVSSGTDTLLGAVDVEGGNGRVVGGLLGEVGDGDGFGFAGDASGGARGLGGWCCEGRMRVIDFPVALRASDELQKADGKH